MYISGVTLEEFTKITADVSAKRYEGNLIVHRDSDDLHGVRRPRIKARLGVVDSGYGLYGSSVNKCAPGARRSSQQSSNPEGKPRRLCVACWHTYRDVLTELFDRHPDALVRTALAVYRGKDDFEDKFEETGWGNCGSLYRPVYLKETCEC